MCVGLNRICTIGQLVLRNCATKKALPIIATQVRTQFRPAIQGRLMSYNSSNKVHNQIKDLISNSKKSVFVFMKGEPKSPACGYSAAVVQILNAYGVEFESCDVMENSDIRQEIKSYSDWPTIPQVYMNGSFVGGCDILLQMHQSGELKQMFGDGSESKSSSDGEQKSK